MRTETGTVDAAPWEDVTDNLRLAVQELLDHFDHFEQSIGDTEFQHDRRLSKMVPGRYASPIAYSQCVPAQPKLSSTALCAFAWRIVSPVSPALHSIYSNAVHTSASVAPVTVGLAQALRVSINAISGPPGRHRLGDLLDIGLQSLSFRLGPAKFTIFRWPESVKQQAAELGQKSKYAPHQATGGGAAASQAALAAPK